MKSIEKAGRFWPQVVVRMIFEQYIAGETVAQIAHNVGVPENSIWTMVKSNGWSSMRNRAKTQWADMAEAIGTAAITSTLESLSASSKVLRHANVCLDSDTPLKAAEIASIASALTDSTELLCRLLGK